jgi:hypothetical protein
VAGLKSEYPAGFIGIRNEEVVAADLLEAYEARIAALERLVGKQALELEFKGALCCGTPVEKRAHIRHSRPCGLSAAEGCRLMNVARSTLYDEPPAGTDDTAVVEAMSDGRDRPRATRSHDGRLP